MANELWTLNLEPNKMSQAQIYTGIAAMILAAIGMWLALPRGDQPGRLLGTILALASFVIFGLLGARLGSTASELALVVIAAVTLVSAAATVTFRSPVYCALWFALSLLGTAALFMMQGAQFLGVATIVVYAGAILVTFLFVLMLAQPTGYAFYDRVSWEGMFAATTGAVVIGFLTMTVVRVLNPYVDPDFVAALDSFQPEETGGLQAEHIRQARLVGGSDQGWTMDVELSEDAPMLSRTDEDRLESHLLLTLPELKANTATAADFDLVVTQSRDPITSAEPQARTAKGGVLTAEHVATLGGQLFGRHLIAIEAAGTLLLAALVGAIAIVSHQRPHHPTAQAADRYAAEPGKGY